MPPEIDEHTIELIAARVASALREELETIAAQIADRERPLTVGDVAKRFGVARSTVYAHWQDWGGYKLGVGEKAAIRFHPAALPDDQSKAARARQPAPPPARRHRGRTILQGEPRLPSDLA